MTLLNTAHTQEKIHNSRIIEMSDDNVTNLSDHRDQQTLLLAALRTDDMTMTHANKLVALSALIEAMVTVLELPTPKDE